MDGAHTRPDYTPMIDNEDVLKDDAWTPYREALRYRRLLLLSMLLNVILAAALINCLR
jgi:hypothetical protein